MNEIEIGKAPPVWIVLPFYATGALFFLFLTILLYFSSGDFTSHYFSPHLLASVHTGVLGWGTMIIFGAAYELLPVLSQSRLYSNRLAFASYLFLLIGVLFLIPAFWKFEAGTFMILGGSFCVLATLCYVFNVLNTGSTNAHYKLSQYFLTSSALWLLITVTLGLCLAINLRYPFISRNHLDIMKLHAHAGLVGWFLQLITGVSVKLVPMFLVSRSDKIKTIYWAWVLQNIGLLLFLVDNHLNPGNDRDWIYAIIVALGIFIWLRYLNDVRKNRLRKSIDLPMKQTLISFGFLLLALIAIPISLFQEDSKWTLLYGTLLILGWITSIILGQTFKTLPFIVWNEIYKNAPPSNAVPMPKHLFSEQLLRLQWYLYLVAMGVLVIGIIISQTIIIKIAMLIWVLVALLYIVNVGKVLLHKFSKHEIH